MHKERFITLSLVILAAALSRLLPHPANMTPIAAIALFGAAHFERKWLAFAVPLAAMLLSDLIIGFYAQMWVTYLAFAAIVGIGFFIKNNIRPLVVLSASITSSVLFFIVTNNALWLPYDLYPKTWDGMVEGYIAAIPFFTNSLFGDLFYTALLFGGFALAEKKWGWLKLCDAPATTRRLAS